MQICRGREFPTEGRASAKALVFKEQLGQCGWNRLGFAKGRMEEDFIIKGRGQKMQGCYQTFKPLPFDRDF